VETAVKLQNGKSGMRLKRWPQPGYDCDTTTIHVARTCRNLVRAGWNKPRVLYKECTSLCRGLDWVEFNAPPDTV